MILALADWLLVVTIVLVILVPLAVPVVIVVFGRRDHRDRSAALEGAAADLGFRVIDRTDEQEPVPTKMSGQVEAWEMTITTWSETTTTGETAGATGHYTRYVLTFPEPIGPPGFTAEWRSRLNWTLVRLFIEKRADRVRRVGRWALTADDFDQLEAWLTTPLPNHLTPADSGSDRMAVIAAMRGTGPVDPAAALATGGPVQGSRHSGRESTRLARLSPGKWEMSAHDVKFTAAVRLTRTRVVAHARGMAAVAKALSA